MYHETTDTKYTFSCVFAEQEELHLLRQKIRQDMTVRDEQDATYDAVSLPVELTGQLLELVLRPVSAEVGANVTGSHLRVRYDFAAFNGLLAGVYAVEVFGMPVLARLSQRLELDLMLGIRGGSGLAAVFFYLSLYFSSIVPCVCTAFAETTVAPRPSICLDKLGRSAVAGTR